jgi:hypothetical protein
MKRTLIGPIVLAFLPLLVGCVERKMMIRSEPAGAPAWVDEEPVGNTPVEVPFQHYGRRRIRVGPILGEEENIEYMAAERMLETVPPWYELFPFDFFSEVLWPGTLVDTHQIQIQLSAPQERYQLRGLDAAREVREEAEQYRRESLSAIPER